MGRCLKGLLFVQEVIDVVDARKVKEMVAKKSSQLMGSVSGATKLPPHKHCRICQEAISVKAEPRVCKNPACIERNQKDEKNQKTVRIAMFVFFGLFAVPYVLVLVSNLVG